MAGLLGRGRLTPRGGARPAPGDRRQPCIAWWARPSAASSSAARPARARRAESRQSARRRAARQHPDVHGRRRRPQGPPAASATAAAEPAQERRQDDGTQEEVDREGQRPAARRRRARRPVLARRLEGAALPREGVVEPQRRGSSSRSRGIRHERRRRRAPSCGAAASTASGKKASEARAGARLGELQQRACASGRAVAHDRRTTPSQCALAALNIPSRREVAGADAQGRRAAQAASARAPQERSARGLRRLAERRPRGAGADRARRRQERREGARSSAPGGGVTGAVYEIGCLRALDELLDRSVARPRPLRRRQRRRLRGLAAGRRRLAPRDVRRGDRCASRGTLGAASADPLFRLGRPDLAARASAQAPRVLAEALRTACRRRGATARATSRWSLFELLPAGLLDNSGIQEYLARALRARGWAPIASRGSPRELYIVAVDLDSGEAVAFGEQAPPRRADLARRSQASTALPGLYRPVRISGRDYVDGGVQEDRPHQPRDPARAPTWSICINPIVPVLNDTASGPLARPPQQQRRHLRARPGDAHHAARPHGSTGWSATSASTPRSTSCC